NLIVANVGEEEVRVDAQPAVEEGALHAELVVRRSLRTRSPTLARRVVDADRAGPLAVRDRAVDEHVLAELEARVDQPGPRRFVELGLGIRTCAPPHRPGGGKLLGRRAEKMRFGQLAATPDQ